MTHVNVFLCQIGGGLREVQYLYFILSVKILNCFF